MITVAVEDVAWGAEAEALAVSAAEAALDRPGELTVLLTDDASTVFLTTADAGEDDLKRMRAAGAGVRVLPAGPGGVDLTAALAQLRAEGVRSVLVEGGAQVITSLLGAGLVDRIVVGTAPRIIGAGTEAVGDLGVARVTEGITLRNRSVHLTADDVVMAWDVG